jgi:hypothetical protein
VAGGDRRCVPQVDNRVGVAHARIIDQYIEASEGLCRGRDRAARCRGIGEIAHNHTSLAAGGMYPAQGFLQPGCRPADTDDAGTTGRELVTQRLPPVRLRHR